MEKNKLIVKPKESVRKYKKAKMMERMKRMKRMENIEKMEKINLEKKYLNKAQENLISP